MTEVTTSLIKHLHPFLSFNENQLKLVLQQSKTIALENGDRLQAMDHLEQLVYLLDGRICFFHNFSSQHVLSASDEMAKYSLFENTDDPSNFYAEAVYSSEFLLIEKSSFDNIVFDELFTSETVNTPKNIETHLYQEIEHAIDTDQLILPSLPEIALRVKAAIKKESITAHDIEIIIESDPVMALRIIQVANSILIRGRTPIDSLRDAIVRIGTSKTHDIVISLSVVQLFKSESKLLKKQMISLYTHSIEISAISYAIAEQFSPLNAERLLLAGLLHDIGTIPILAYIEHDLIDIETEFENEAELQSTITKLRPLIGSMIISKWNITERMIPVVEEAEKWERNPSNKIDMCDIINSAHILNYYKKGQLDLIPDINETPGFQKLFPNVVDISECGEILKQANEKISEIKSLIHV